MDNAYVSAKKVTLSVIPLINRNQGISEVLISDLNEAN